MIYRVADKPSCVVEASVTIQGLSEGRGKAIVSVFCKWACASLKHLVSSSVQAIFSLPSLAATAWSNPLRKAEQFGSTRDRTLYAPINDLSAVTVIGNVTWVKAATLCGEAVMVPLCQIHPSSIRTNNGFSRCQTHPRVL